jgi:aryl-alcohol dehydrogenase-like predicted oxidoreductase
LRWLLRQDAVTSILVSAKTRAQVESNLEAMLGDIAASVFDALSAISDRVRQEVPDEGNPFGYHP